MKAKIIYNPFIKNDLKEINKWYNEIDVKLWMAFINDYRLKINFIKENPTASEVRYDDCRIVFLKKFPFGIHYQFDEKHQTIKIFAVFHTSRNPENWTSRK